MTGKTKDGLSVGVVQSITAKDNATIYDADSKTKIATEPFTSYVASRVKQDFNKGNTVIGGMLTSTIRDINDEHLGFLPKSSTVGGIDLQHNWKKRKYFVDFKGFFSDIQGSKEAISDLQLSSVHYYQRADADYLEYDPERTSLSGWGGLLQGGKRSGKFRVTGSLNWRSPGVDFNDMGYLYQADLVDELINITYKVTQPKGIVRNYYVELEQERDWTYGGENTLDRLKLHGYLKSSNLWSVHLNMRRFYNIFDTRELRGGPALYKGAYNDIDLFIQSNSTKDLWVGFGPIFRFHSDQISKTSLFQAKIKWQVNDRFSITSNTTVDGSVDHHQYVSVKKDQSGTIKYLVGTVDRHTIYSTLRFEYFISPEISIQYYGNPYASIGKYDRFREVADASNRSLDKQYTNLNAKLVANNNYQLLKNNELAYTIKNPDFNYQVLNSNLVGRWEFKPGSTLYLVWTNTRYSKSDKLDSSVLESFGNIMNVKSENVFMIKFSYWFSL